MAKKIQIANDLWVDIDNIPDDFSEQILAAFEQYTSGTAKDYRYQDKLHFVDLCVRRLRGDKDESDIVKHLIMESVEFQLDEYGDLPDATDYNAIEFMEYCAGAGRKNARLYFDCNEGRVGEKKMQVLDLIITALYADTKGGGKIG